MFGALISKALRRFASVEGFRSPPPSSYKPTNPCKGLLTLDKLNPSFVFDCSRPTKLSLGSALCKVRVRVRVYGLGNLDLVRIVNTKDDIKP